MEVWKDIWTILKWFFTELVPQILFFDLGPIGTIKDIITIMVLITGAAIAIIKSRR